MPKISVIIPLYNKAKYIRRALNSVFAQTFRDYEIIVVDDGSTDSGPEIVESYNDTRLKLIHQKNAGPGAARNKAIENSSAEFLAFLDADDEWLPMFLENNLHALSRHPDCALSACTYFLGAERKDVSWIFRQYGMTQGPWQLPLSPSDYELKHAIYIMHSSTTLCRRGVIEKYGGFYSRDICKHSEDYYLWLQIMFNHKLYRILQPLVWFHLEASELGTKNQAFRPLPPFLTDIKPIRKNCPPQYRGLLERWLAQFALALAHECAYAGNVTRATYLMDKFPLMKEFGFEYRKLKLKLKMPRLIRPVRYIKKNIPIFAKVS